MRKFKILWIDDDWASHTSTKPDENFGTQFRFLSDIANTLKMVNPNIEIETTGTIGDGYTELNLSNKYDFVILDLDFKNENRKTQNQQYSFKNIIDLVNQKSIRFALFTSHRKAFSKELEEVTLHSKDLMLGLYEKHNVDHFIEEIGSISNFVSLNIVHLSDFHFDSTLSGRQEEDQEKRFDKLIEIISTENKSNPIDLLIFSGDFGNKNPKNDLKQCAKIIRRLVKSSIKDFSRLLLVPGNHDVQWDDFSSATISKYPCKPFYDFFDEVYDSNPLILSQLYGYNDRSNSFDKHFEPDSFCWARNFNNNSLQTMGLNSAVIDPKIIGKGLISDNVISYLQKQWSHIPSKNDFRIAILHHNILPPFSLNSLDENENLLNSGKMIEVLSNLGCDLLLSGHCHDTYLYNFQYSVLEHPGFSKQKNLMYISSGTTGGYTPTGDRARSFNLIRINPSKHANQKKIHLIPYVYDSRRTQWIMKETLNSTINQNRE